MAKSKAKPKPKKKSVVSLFPPHARLFTSHIVGAGAPPVVRKSADLLSPQEQQVFQSAVTKAIADGTYSRLVQIHADMNHDMHTMSHMPAGTMRFLPWHRTFLMKFEQALQAFEPTFFVPHWRWMDQKNIPAWMIPFKPSGVVSATGTPIPITRDPGGDPSAPTLPTTQQIQTTVMIRTDYRAFTLALEGAQPFGAHNLVHVWFHGTMSVVPTAPADPMFWMHHAEIDRLWAIWSAAHPGQEPTLSGHDAILDPWTESDKDVLGTSDSGYSYSYDQMTL
ncbi:MAG TPA: tyrosinase family protein [Planctomycetota bacterium]|nr:tyrosinase family protein [Planctomycetota bacterium]